MVAYNFQPRFIAPIQARTKRGTIRARGRRIHAEPGKLVQLYTGMRTRACRRIVPDVVCETVTPVVFDLRGCRRDSPLNAALIVGGTLLSDRQSEAFAQADGFDCLVDMVRFWLAAHGAILFEGLHISWTEAKNA